MSSAIVLRPMDAAQTAAYRRQVLDGYIAQQVEFGGFTADEAHERARASGCSVIGLNVFGGNDLAIGLYKSLGFRVQAQQMRLEL